MIPRSVTILRPVSRRYSAGKAVYRSLNAVAARSIASTSAAKAHVRPPLDAIPAGFNPLTPSSTSKKAPPAQAPEAFLVPELVPKTHGIPVGLVQFKSHHPERLRLMLHFAMHAARALGMPCSAPATLPTRRSLITVLKSPFVHKSAQENFTESNHFRAIKVYDTHPLVFSQWLQYLEENMLGGVVFKAVKWQREAPGFGEKMKKDAETLIRNAGSADSQRVKDLADEIIEREMKAAGLKPQPPAKPASPKLEVKATPSTPPS